jgi:membrane protease YdiL (CAAX protease family)
MNVSVDSLSAATSASGATPPTPPPSAATRIFFGPFGLRAGWSLLLYIAILAASVLAIRFIHDKIAHPPSHKPIHASSTQASPKPDDSIPQPVRGMITQEGIVFAALFLISWLLSAIERRRLAVFGLGGTRSLSRLATGALWGLIAMATLVGSLRIFHLLSFDALLDHGPSILVWGAAQLFAFLLVGLLEEYLFRGYLQFTLTRGMVGLAKRISPTHARSIAFWIAAFLTSVLFLLAHTSNGGETPLGLISVFLAGMIFVIALWRTGSLWWAIGFHTTWDWSQSFLYGVPDSGGLIQGRLFATHPLGNPLLSGGTVGPEGSLLLIPVLSLILIVIFRTHNSPQPPLEQTH